MSSELQMHNNKCEGIELETLLNNGCDEIPNDVSFYAAEWPRLLIDEIKSSAKSSIAIGPFGSRMKSDCYVADGVRVVRGTNISSGRTFSGEFVFITPDKAKELGGANLSPNDLVFPHRGSIGEIGIVPEDGNQYVISSSLMKLTCDESIANPLFVFYFFKSSLGKFELLKNASQVGTPGIGQPLSSLKSIYIPLPPLSVQSEIATIIGTLDDRIALLRETNATLEAMAQALFKSWFVDFDPVHANAGTQIATLPPELQTLFPATFTETPNGLVPEGWEWSTIAQSFILTMGQSPPGDTYNETAEGLPFYQGRTDYGFRFPTQRVFCTAPTRLAQRGDSLVSVRAPVGDVNIALEDCALGRGVAGVRHPKNYNSFVFYALQLLRPHFEHFNGEGTVFGSINKKDFQNLPVIEAPKSVLDAFEGVVSFMDSQIENNELKLRTLATLRDTLLPRLISGQLRLPEAESALAEVV